MKVNKQQLKLHHQTMDLVYSDKVLNEDERHFILEHYNEAVNQHTKLIGAFFTPLSLAKDFSVMNSCDNGKIIDLCAGIGRLAYHYQNSYSWGSQNELTCIEINPEYVEVGKRAVPEANWILADIFEVNYKELGQFDLAISNPPFGKIKSSNNTMKVDFEFQCLHLASKIAKMGAFIFPQMSAPFKYSGSTIYIDELSKKYRDFLLKTHFNYQYFCSSIDASYATGLWNNTKQLCEVMSFDFEEPLYNYSELAVDSNLQCSLI